MLNSNLANKPDYTELTTNERLTGEIYNGKPVYTKLLTFAMPNNTSVNIGTGVGSVATQVWIDSSNSFAGVYPIPYVDPAVLANCIGVRLQGTSTLVVTTRASWSGYTGSVVIKYVK